MPLPRMRAAVVAGLAAILALASLFPPLSTAANAPPDPPVIASPAATDVGAEDVHMEMGAPFRDPDGDAHQATDWEIRTGDGATVAWAGYASPELSHAHFSDGDFQGPLAGQRRLAYKADYLFRVRYQDSRGAWSAWSERAFMTRDQVQIPARQVRGILIEPAPIWRSDGGASITLAAGAHLTLESGDGAALLTLAGAGDGLTVTPGTLLPEPSLLRFHLVAPPDAALSLPSSRLSVVSDHAERLTIFLPALRLGAGGARVLWVSETGATFYGTPEETQPNRQRLARDIVLPWQLEPGYRLAAVSGAFQLPTSLAFVDTPGTDPAAPRFYVTELYGRIKVVTNDGRVFNFAENLLNVNPTGAFPGSGELGVIGVCLPPDSHDVFATMVFRDSAGSLRNKVVRIRSRDGLEALDVEDILVARPGQGLARASHQVQQCSFGPDGKLYVFMADGPDPANAQADASFGGKVLRLNPDGSAPADNPRYDPADPAAPISYQYTKGHRNAYGMTWRQADGQLYLTENGPDVDRLVRLIPGHNYGWDGTDASMRTNALYVWPEAHWSPVGLTFVEGPGAGALPSSKQGRLLVASAGSVYAHGPQHTGKMIQEFTLPPEGAVAGEPTIFARYVGEGRGSIVDLRLRPDGLYFSDIYFDDGDGGASAPGGTVWRIRYAGQAGFAPSTATGPAPLTVTFTDTSTLIGAAAWAWDFGDGQMSIERSPTHTFSQPGRYAVALTVTAADGTTDEHLTLITVTDAAGSVPSPPPVTAALPTVPPSQTVFFPETGMGLGGGFKHYWEAHGGLAQFGYPITNEFREVSPTDGREYTVQYFERARFEYHPEHRGTRHETQLGLVGRQFTSRRGEEAPFQPLSTAPTAATLVFAETGHTLSGAFRAHWEATGGLAIYGLPISEPFEEQSLTDGQVYLIQFFERARLEHHPTAAGTIDEMRLGRLGTAVFVRRPGPRLPG